MTDRLIKEDDIADHIKQLKTPRIDDEGEEYFEIRDSISLEIIKQLQGRIAELEEALENVLEAASGDKLYSGDTLDKAQQALAKEENKAND